MKPEETMIRDLTQGSVTLQLIGFSIPLIAANTLQAVYNLVDMVVVGRVIGGNGMSAVSIGGDILHLLTFLATGFSAAGQVIIARCVGSGERKELQKLTGTLFTFLLGSALLLSAGCFLFRDLILRGLHTPSESWKYTMDYLVICSAGLFFIYGYNIVSAILRGMGDSRRPFLFIAIASTLNISLDILFVAVFHMEVFGAALATVLGQGLSFLISLTYLFRKRRTFGFDFQPKSFQIDRSALRQLLRLGIPMAVQQASISISKIILTGWINAEGVIYSALAGIYNKIGIVMAVITNSFTTAGSAMISQNLGAKKPGRVRSVLGIISMTGLLCAITVSGYILAFPNRIFRLFTSDEKVLSESAIIIIPAAINIYGYVMRSPAFSIINGSGHARMNLLIAILDGMIARIAIAALLGFRLGMGAKGFWFGDALAGFVPVLVGTVFYLSGKWK